MPATVEIRDVPDEIHRTLKGLAASAGMTIGDYLLQDVKRVARRQVQLRPASNLEETCPG